jgi:hypothetical protein
VKCEKPGVVFSDYEGTLMFGSTCDFELVLGGAAFLSEVAAAEARHHNRTVGEAELGS